MAALPLNLRRRETLDQKTGRIQGLDALHPCWCQNASFLPFTEGDMADSMWVETLQLMNSDLKWLLGLCYDDFWNQVVYDSSVQIFLDSYLQRAPRNVTLKSRQLEKDVHKRVFLVYLRMSTHKETSECFMHGDAFGDVVYSNYLFDIPKMLDLCQLYSQGNKKLLTKMLANVFDKQPKYYKDLKASISALLKVLQSVSRDISLLSEGGINGLPDEEKICDYVLFLSDTASSLYTFIEIGSFVQQSFCEANVIPILISFYEDTYPLLQSLVKKLTFSKKAAFRQAKENWINLAHLLIQKCFIESSNKSYKGEDLLAICMTLLSSANFIRQLQRQYNLLDLVQLILEANKQLIDEANRVYLTEAMTAILEQQKCENPVKCTAFSKESVNGKTANSDEVIGAALSSCRSNSIVAEVKEILPHLSDHFISECLKECSHDPALVVSAVLENRLSLRLQRMLTGTDQAEQENTVSNQSPTVQTQAATTSSLLDKRHSIYDHDEFDMFHCEDVNTSQIHRGKKQMNPDSILNDKEGLAVSRNKILEAFEYEVDEYEDEYDDTYDTGIVSVKELFNNDQPDLGNEDNGKTTVENTAEAQHGGVPLKDGHGKNNKHGSQSQHKGYSTRKPQNLKKGATSTFSIKSHEQRTGSSHKEEELRQHNRKEKNKAFTANHNRKKEAQKKYNQRGF